MILVANGYRAFPSNDFRDALIGKIVENGKRPLVVGASVAEGGGPEALEGGLGRLAIRNAVALAHSKLRDQM